MTIEEIRIPVKKRQEKVQLKDHIVHIQHSDHPVMMRMWLKDLEKILHDARCEIKRKKNENI